MNYLLINAPNTDVHLSDLSVNGIRVANIAEVIRKMGIFSHTSIRKRFFETCSKTDVKLKNPIVLPRIIWEGIEEEIIGKNSEKLN